MGFRFQLVFLFNEEIPLEKYIGMFGQMDTIETVLKIIFNF